MTKDYFTAVYDQHTSTYDLQQGNISRWRKITLLQFMINTHQRMAFSRGILAHDERLPYCSYDQHISTYGLQQGNISRWRKITLLQFMINTHQRMTCSRGILAHDERLPYCSYDQHISTYGLQQGNISRWRKITLLQFMINTHQRMTCSRGILAHDERLPYCSYDQHISTYDLQQGNISTWRKITLLQFMINTHQRMTCSRGILAQD